MKYQLSFTIVHSCIYLLVDIQLLRLDSPVDSRYRL